MKQLSENEKSRWRIAQMMLQHSERFRLLEVKNDELDADGLLNAISDLLDAFEERIPHLCRVSQEDADNGNSDLPSGSALSRKRKQRVSSCRR